VRGEAGRRDWIEQLRTRGAEVDVVSAFRSEPVEPGQAELEELARWAGADAPAAFVFSSVDSIDATLALLARQGTIAWATRQLALVVHARHARRLDEAGWRATRLIEPGESMLVQALESAVPMHAIPRP
jgi:uroporphyrinogen-III synthase